jgi:hypothetical protein
MLSRPAAWCPHETFALSFFEFADGDSRLSAMDTKAMLGIAIHGEPRDQPEGLKQN